MSERSEVISAALGIPAVAARGFQTGADAYARARPGYPPEVAEHVVRVAAGGLIVDLAAGTGKLTADLVTGGAPVVAIEPVGAMLGHLVADLPAIPAVRATAEQLPLRHGSAAVVVVAQAFHWFDVPSSLAELARVLRPGGALVVVFNERDETVDWVHRWTEIVVRGGGGRPYTPRAESPWPEVLVSTGHFDLSLTRTVDNPIVTDLGGLVERAASTSFVAALDPAARAAVLDEIRDLVRTHPDTAGASTIVFPHRTEMVSLTRR